MTTWNNWDDFIAEDPTGRRTPHVDLPGDWGRDDEGLTIVPGTGEVVAFERRSNGTIRVAGQLDGPLTNAEAHKAADIAGAHKAADIAGVIRHIMQGL